MCVWRHCLAFGVSDYTLLVLGITLSGEQAWREAAVFGQETSRIDVEKGEKRI